MTSVSELLIKLSIKHEGDFQNMWKAIIDKEEIDNGILDEALKKIKCGVICINQDELYPDYLRKIYMPPMVLYYYGDISLIKDYKNNVAVIGARECSEYGVNTTKKIISELNKDIVIVSGLAKGIDSVAHYSAIKNGLKTIAVLGNGIDMCYPIENTKLYNSILKHGGLIISEYPFKTQPNLSSFPMRNRIIAALSSSVLVTEAKNRSGTQITVNRALELGRDVYCVPYPYGSDSFCNRLISEGATLINSGSQINEECCSK